MKSDYFVVGPHFELTASLNVEDNEHIFPCTFDLTRDREHIGHLTARLDNNKIWMSLKTSTSFETEELAEVYRLFSRICIRLGRHQFKLVIQVTDDQVELKDLLSQDNFIPITEELLERSSDPFVLPPGSKGDSMEDVYRDLLYTPWNFVPREWDVLEMLGEHTLSPSHTLLDLGCGVGKNAILLEDLGYKVFGIDISPTAIKRCQRFVSHPERFVVGSVTHLPYPNEAFDVVLDVGCLHCLPKEEMSTTVVEIQRVLRENGKLYSRIFKPRPQEWLEDQPFKVDDFGLETSEVFSLLQSLFDIEICRPEANMTYVCCRKKGRVL
ncbi:class I SAM-dependent methyltransferase [Thermoactinomyces sp. DSM 45892]|uniref:class I SAM-dependent methyltransferase n=1 Tax=Thermoactinomyces sp. DSM 45892 TaxID=1882753 RepID=UPI000899A437|nr:class I SAM-dependent methyltransferase [Thermoactinomyces sp. DSM 45892]SDY10769.1 Methyltransferase domain-containing protein [Thermoactinomyces sp. DSM 45892]